MPSCHGILLPICEARADIHTGPSSSTAGQLPCVPGEATNDRDAVDPRHAIRGLRSSIRTLSRLPLLKRRVDSGAVRIMPPPAGLVRLRRLSEFLRRVRQVIGIAGGAQSWGSLKSDEAH